MSSDSLSRRRIAKHDQSESKSYSLAKYLMKWHAGISVFALLKYLTYGRLSGSKSN